MQTQISIFGLIIAGVFYLIAFITIAFAVIFKKKLRSWKKILGLILIIIILPWVDEFWISWRFSQLCKDAGVHITRKVEVDGFYDDVIGGGYELVDKYGYKFMEQKSPEKGKIEHIEKVNGEWKISTLDKPTARYHYKLANPHQEVLVALQIEKNEEVIVDSETGEIIGRDIKFNRYPGVIEGLWIRFFGSGQITCGGPLDQPEKQKRYGLLYNYVLIPTQKK